MMLSGMICLKYWLHVHVHVFLQEAWQVEALSQAHKLRDCLFLLLQRLAPTHAGASRPGCRPGLQRDERRGCLPCVLMQIAGNELRQRNVQLGDYERHVRHAHAHVHGHVHVVLGRLEPSGEGACVCVLGSLCCREPSSCGCAGTRGGGLRSTREVVGGRVCVPTVSLDSVVCPNLWGRVPELPPRFLN